MPNAIKYSTNSQSLALKSGNFWFGVGDVAKGPTSVTDYWNGITPSPTGYSIYINKASNGPSIYCPSNNTQLLSLTNSLFSQSFTAVSDTFEWYITQVDRVVVNKDYESIVTDGLVLNLDAGFIPSYPRKGTTWTNLSTGNTTGTLINGPTFNGDNSGSIVFDGVNNVVTANTISVTDWTIQVWLKSASVGGNLKGIFEFAFQSNTRSGIGINTNGRPIIAYPTGNYRVSTGNAIDNNTWCCLTAILSGGTPSLYLNGDLQTLGGVQSAGDASSTNIIFIGDLALNGYRLNGNISSVFLYNRALSAAEVLQNYNATKDRYSIITSGLKLYLDAGNTASYPGTGTTWTDISNNGSNGTLTNGPTFSSADGGSIVFDGIDDFAALSSLTAYSGTQAHSYLAWVYPTSGLTGNKVILRNSDPANAGGTSLYTIDGKIGFFFSGLDSANQGINSLTLNAWQQVCVTYLGNTSVIMYLNGLLDATRSTTDPQSGLPKTNWGATNSNPRICSNVNGFIGRISNVQVYDRALSAAEVLQNFNVNKGRYGL